MINARCFARKANPNSVEMNQQNLLDRADLPAIMATAEAAAAINRKPQTLRKWACLENGPIRPIRINGRLAWRVKDLQALLTDGDRS